MAGTAGLEAIEMSHTERALLARITELENTTAAILERLAAMEHRVTLLEALVRIKAPEVAARPYWQEVLFETTNGGL